MRNPVYTDDRGFFTEVFRADRFADAELPARFEQDNHSRSRRSTIRGLHYQLGAPQGKLVRAVRGAIFDVAVDIRRSSATFGQWFGTELREGDGRQLWIPAGFAHGFLALTELADVSYKCTTVYDPLAERSVRFDDPAIAIAWPLPAGELPIVSTRDRQAPFLAEATVFV